MSAAKARTSTRASGTKGARGRAKGTAKGAARSAAKSAAKGASAGGERIGRGTRWTEDQVSLLLDTVKGSSTAKEAFETVARQLGKSTGTVQQKYYNLKKQSGGGTKRRGRPAASAGARPRGRAGGGASRGGAGVPNATDLRGLSVDELVRLTQLVKDEVTRRSSELDRAKALLPS